MFPLWLTFQETKVNKPQSHWFMGFDFLPHPLEGRNFTISFSQFKGSSPIVKIPLPLQVQWISLYSHPGHGELVYRKQMRCNLLLSQRSVVLICVWVTLSGWNFLNRVSPCSYKATVIKRV